MLRLGMILAAAITMRTAALAQSSPGWLGISFRGQTAVVVDAVFPGGPAERAGVLPGDSLMQIGGHAATFQSVDSALLHLTIGTSITLTLQRHGLTKVIRVISDPRPQLERATSGLVVDVDSVRMLASAYLDGARRLLVIAPTGFTAERSDSGLTVTGRGGQVRINVDSVVARGRSLPIGGSLVDTIGDRSVRVLRQAAERIGGLRVTALGTSGSASSPRAVVVVGVEPDSPLATFGVRPLDLILKINDEATPDLAALRRAVVSARQITTITVLRKGETLLLRR